MKKTGDLHVSGTSLRNLLVGGKGGLPPLERGEGEGILVEEGDLVTIGQPILQIINANPKLNSENTRLAMQIAKDNYNGKNPIFNDKNQIFGNKSPIFRDAHPVCCDKNQICNSKNPIFSCNN